MQHVPGQEPIQEYKWLTDTFFVILFYFILSACVYKCGIYIFTSATSTSFKN